MSRFTTREDTKVIQAPWWDEDEQVVIRRFTWGDRQKLTQAVIEIDIIIDGSKPRIDEVQTGHMNIGRMNVRIMELGIKSWTFRGPGGKIVPLTRKWISQLDDKTGDYILREINAFNPRRIRSAEEQASFRGAGGDGAVEQQRTTNGADTDSGDGDDGVELGSIEGDSS